VSQPEPKYGDLFKEIYMKGLGGELPTLPLEVGALEAAANEAMEDRAAGYIAAAAGSEQTLKFNREAFERYRIVPRMLRDVSGRNHETEILGTKMPAPVMLAPIGIQTQAHPDGELASAAAANEVGLPWITSTAADKTLEEIAEANGDGERWFQLYWTNDDSITASMVQRAEAAGYKAIVITVDTFIPGWKTRDLQMAWLPFVNQIGVANFFSDPAFRAGLEKTPEEDPGMATGHYIGSYVNPSLTWDRINWLRDHTSLPILIKGIQHPDDAREAIKIGIDGIVVSNHGGRQVDGAVASLDALPAVAAAVDGAIPILFDSGIRTGSDILKALALGADAVLLGRPYIWGLALEGQAGVEKVLRQTLADYDLAMALSGFNSPAELTPEALVETR
jgi:lactate 2-monooxygenase